MYQVIHISCASIKAQTSNRTGLEKTNSRHWKFVRISFSFFSGPEHHHLHHPPLEASLSHCTGDSNPGMNQANKHQSSHFFSSRQHATITSNSAASLEMAAASQLQVPIKGKLLSLRLKKGQIDKAHKDKTSQRFPDNFSVTLFLVKPEDQSEKLLDYSLYSPAFLMQSMPDQVGILLLDIFLVKFFSFVIQNNSTKQPKILFERKIEKIILK